MIKRVSLAICMATIALTSCQNNAASDSSTTVSAETNAEETAVIDMHTSQTALDWNGKYEGTLPCADCPGIKTTITLNEDNTFVKEVEYLERKDANFIDSGIIEWHEDGNTITLVSDGKEKQILKVREGNLLMLDQAGEVLTGSLADFYVLMKKN